jgi:hypothetical protein
MGGNRSREKSAYGAKHARPPLAALAACPQGSDHPLDQAPALLTSTGEHRSVLFMMIILARSLLMV